MRLPRLDGRELVAIYAGGVAGALARVGLAQAAPHGAASWPWAATCSSPSCPGAGTTSRTRS